MGGQHVGIVWRRGEDSEGYIELEQLARKYGALNTDEVIAR
jgi:hypothetical protein